LHEMTKRNCRRQEQRVRFDKPGGAGGWWVVGGCKWQRPRPRPTMTATTTTTEERYELHLQLQWQEYVANGKWQVAGMSGRLSRIAARFGDLSGE